MDLVKSNKELSEIKKRLKKALYEGRIKRQNRLEINTAFNFLLNINGWRKGALTIVLGTTSSGKSTLMRSIIVDLLEKNKRARVTCYLSEETEAELFLELYKYFNSVDFEERVSVVSENDCLDEKNMAGQLEKCFLDDSHVLIFDNITTSKLYNSKTPQEQSDFANNLKIMAKRNNKALICVAHTNNVEKMAGKMISSSDIRGSKNISNLAEFFFINYQISSKENLYNYIHIEKHRSQSPEDKIFMLRYDKNRNIFKDDIAVGFEKFKELWKLRDKL